MPLHVRRIRGKNPAQHHCRCKQSAANLPGHLSKARGRGRLPRPDKVWRDMIRDRRAGHAVHACPQLKPEVGPKRTLQLQTLMLHTSSGTARRDSCSSKQKIVIRHIKLVSAEDLIMPLPKFRQLPSLQPKGQASRQHSQIDAPNTLALPKQTPPPHQRQTILAGVSKRYVQATALGRKGWTSTLVVSVKLPMGPYAPQTNK